MFDKYIKKGKAMVYDWFRNLDGTSAGAIVAFFVSLFVGLLKVIRDGDKITKEVVAESVICATFSSGLVGLMVYFLDVNVMFAAFIGCFVANIGSKQIAATALSILKIKTGADKDKPSN